MVNLSPLRLRFNQRTVGTPTVFLLGSVVLCMGWLSGCRLTEAQPTEAQIWQAYAQLSAPRSDDPAAFASRIAFAKDHYTIQRLGSGDATDSPTAKLDPCSPAESQSDETIHGRSTLVHLVSTTNPRERISLDFTLWEQRNDWWISSVTFKGRCGWLAIQAP